MDSSKFKVFIIIVAAAFIAIYLGVAAATAQTAAIAWVAIAVGAVCILALGKNIWLLIPAAISFNGGLNLLPGSPAPWWLAMMITGGIFALRIATRRTGEFTWRWNIIDVVILLHVVMLAQAYLRNPVGLSVFGGSDGMIGGKPYIIHGFAIACYVLLSMVKTDIRMIRIAAIVMIACTFLDSMIVLIGTFVPAVAAIGIQVYSGFSFRAATTGVGADVAEGRTTEGKQVGENLGIAAFTLFRPLSTINPMNFLGFSMMFVAVLSVAISGFRSSMGLLVVFFIVGSIVRGKIADVLLACMVGVLGICSLLFIGTEKLPRSVIRILSVIPIEALSDQQAREHAASSTDWRVEMWILALTTDRYIHNKILGDGFGMRKDEMNAAIEAAFGDRRRAIGMDMQENMMARGSYHGFHVQTIRMTGYVGLLAVLIMLGIFFRHAWSHIQYFKGRPEWGFILFICVPFLIYPFYAMLVFGDYRFGLPQYLIMAGFLKMLWNVRYEEARERALIPSPEPEVHAVANRPPYRRPPRSGYPAPAMGSIRNR